MIMRIFKFFSTVFINPDINIYIFLSCILLGNCRDTGRYCSYHVPRGDCDRMEIVRERCKKSCDLCGEGSGNDILNFLFTY